MSRSIIRGASGESPGVLWGLNPWQRAKQIIRNSPRGDACQDICPLARTSKPINAFALALCDNCIDCFGEKGREDGFRKRKVDENFGKEEVTERNERGSRDEVKRKLKKERKKSEDKRNEGKILKVEF